MRLTDADTTIGTLKTRLYETALNNATVSCDASYLYTECADNRIETWIDEIPTVDAVEVVRCKDCQHYWKNNPSDDVSVCLASPKDDAFCSEGKKRREE